jgi:hypothetical protein
MKKEIIKKINKFWPFGIIVAIFLALYYPIFNHYFSQEDFLFLNVVKDVKTFSDFINLFNFSDMVQKGYSFYRPFFQEGYYFLGYKVFGLNFVGYRAIAVILHLLCVMAVYITLKRFLKNNIISFWVTLFYAISNSQIGTLFYPSGGVPLSGATLFLLLFINIYSKYLEMKKIWLWALAFLCFMISMVSHEIIVGVLVFSLVFLEIYQIKKLNWRSIKEMGLRVIPAIIVLALYLYIDLFKIGVVFDVSYSPDFSLHKLLNTIFWYIGYAFGLPEMLVDFIGPGLKINPNLMLYWGNYFKYIFPLFFLVIAVFLISAIYLFVKNKKAYLNPFLLFFTTWFFAALSPVLFLPWHKFLYYLNHSLIGFYGVVFIIIYETYILLKKSHSKLAKLYFGIFVFLLVSLNVASIKNSEITYWSIGRSKVAKNLVEEFAKQYPSLPKGAVVYWKNDPNYAIIKNWGNSSTQAYYALSVAGRDALQLFYNDNSLRVYYEDIEKPPISDNTIQIIAIISQDNK